MRDAVQRARAATPPTTQDAGPPLVVAEDAAHPILELEGLRSLTQEREGDQAGHKRYDHSCRSQVDQSPTAPPPTKYHHSKPGIGSHEIEQREPQVVPGRDRKIDKEQWRKDTKAKQDNTELPGFPSGKITRRTGRPKVGKFGIQFLSNDGLQVSSLTPLARIHS